MADINFGVSPYNDRFDPNSNRNKVLFRPDRALQQAELNEMQSIAEYNVRQLGDSIFEDGAMQTGMSFSIDADAKKITVEDGSVYLAGRVRKFKKQTIPFNSSGTEKIGCFIEIGAYSKTCKSLIGISQHLQSDIPFLFSSR